MLQYNIRKVIHARGIEKPFAFLVKSGLTPGVATRIINKPNSVISLPTLEKLCYALHCTPNDLLHWVPDNSHPLPADHPMHTVGHTLKAKNMLQHIRSLPFDKLNEVERFIKEMELKQNDSSAHE